MALPTDQNAEPAGDTATSRALISRRDHITHEWASRIRQRVKGAKELSDPVLIDTLPKFLDNLAEALSPKNPRADPGQSNNLLFEHGSDRARHTTFGPEQLVEEYQILHEVLLEQLGPELSEANRNMIRKAIDQAVRESIVNFFLERTRLKDQFVAAVTHDLRNPLAAAKLSCEMLLGQLPRVTDGAIADRLRRLTDRALKNVKRVDGLIQDLLDTSLLRSGEKMVLRLGRCRVRQVLEEVVEQLSPEAQKRIVCEGDDPVGIWDSESLRRALENLLNNAFKYGDEKAPVRVVVCEEFGRLQLSVHNEGNPIPLVEQSKLFEPFRRSESAKASGKEGWGIGLTLVRGVAHSHGGTLILDSSAERGTTFTIDLPMDASPFQKAAA